MKSTFNDTILVAILSFLIHLSEVRDWVAISVGVVSFMWITHQLVARIIEDLNKQRNKSKSN
ncbi:MAG: hypothetical protein GDA51_01855 [Ekhidna sp.]|nr:hypothetical protein [Ekhidna sp.]MBC6410915.1 hypothetical protein [Ekhidna sp.]MBC6425220.1 hypothetical protein [Ekhidna sp.]